jgi:hypothetical protein
MDILVITALLASFVSLAAGICKVSIQARQRKQSQLQVLNEMLEVRIMLHGDEFRSFTVGPKETQRHLAKELEKVIKGLPTQISAGE